MIRVGVIGLGYWGPNLVRCFSELPNSKVTMVCDRDVDRLIRLTERFPGIRPTESVDDVLSSDLVDAVVIATPTQTHHQIAARALDSGLHTFVEKPLATSSAECRDLIQRAAANNVRLFVGHVFLHSAPVNKLRELIDNGELGEVCYISSTRLNLGPVRQDVNALWDLAPHDISIMLHLLGEQPTAVSCTGLAHLNRRVHDVCNLTLHFRDDRLGIVHVSWLDPHKKREMTVVGTRKMAVYDDLQQEKVKVYNKGIDAPSHSSDFGGFQYSYRYGDTYSPWINESEPLKAECAEFIRSIIDEEDSLTDGVNGLQIVQVLEAADASLRHGAARVELNQELVAPDLVAVAHV
ncbi:MAG: Gfo/Idh/MocA family oxidoreductase [Planctomycetaceae bacterium]|nr:Gfo/Idh/MocA family oxidoreductase [Planctomycetaceae bacterium]